MTSFRAGHPSLRCLFCIAAGPRVGYGHLMRASALARCLDMEVAIALRGGRAARQAASAVAPLVDGPEAWRTADVIVVDDPNHRAGARWVARARRAGLPVVSVHDDIRVHDASVAVIGALGVPAPRTATPLLYGTRYYLLDPRIAGARHLRADRAATPAPVVLIALGGGQHVVAVAQSLVDAILAHRPDADIQVAAGFAAGERPSLRGARWLRVRTGLTRALLAADAAIVAGGVTLYETCALGVPAVAMAVVPAQRPAIRAFARAGAVIDAGDVSSSRAAIAAAAAGVSRVLGNRRLRQSLARHARQLVDGQGAARVARSVRALVAERTRRCA